MIYCAATKGRKGGSIKTSIVMPPRGLPTYLPAFPLAADTSIVMSLLPQKSHSSSLSQIHFATPRRYIKKHDGDTFSPSAYHIYIWISLWLYTHCCELFFTWVSRNHKLRGTPADVRTTLPSAATTLSPIFLYVFPCVSASNPLSLLKRNIFCPVDISCRHRLLRRPDAYLFFLCRTWWNFSCVRSFYCRSGECNTCRINMSPGGNLFAAPNQRDDVLLAAVCTKWSN